MLLTGRGVRAKGFLSTGRTALLPPAVYTIDDLRAACEERTWCPYFVARYMVRVLCRCRQLDAQPLNERGDGRTTWGLGRCRLRSPM
jgi:hypothetical protein